MRTIIFVDIDGVVADIDHRLKFVQGENKEYDKFYGAKMADDRPMEDGIGFVNTMIESSYTSAIDDKPYVVVLTGRPKRTKTLTQLWMKEHAPDIYYSVDEWSFRADRDWRPAKDMKAESAAFSLNKFKHKNKAYDEDIRAVVIDDSPENVKAISEDLKLKGNAKEVISITFGTGRL